MLPGVEAADAVEQHGPDVRPLEIGQRALGCFQDLDERSGEGPLGGPGVARRNLVGPFARPACRDEHVGLAGRIQTGNQVRRIPRQESGWAPGGQILHFGDGEIAVRALGDEVLAGGARGMAAVEHDRQVAGAAGDTGEQGVELEVVQQPPVPAVVPVVEGEQGLAGDGVPVHPGHHLGPVPRVVEEDEVVLPDLLRQAVQAVSNPVERGAEGGQARRGGGSRPRRGQAGDPLGRHPQPVEQEALDLVDVVDTPAQRLLGIFVDADENRAIAGRRIQFHAFLLERCF